MKEPMVKVLFLSVIRSDFSKSLKLALLLRERGLEPEFYFDQRAHDLDQSIREAEALGFRCSGRSRRPSRSAAATPGVSKDPPSYMKGVIFLKRVLSEILACRKIFSSFRQVLRAGNFRLVITPINSFGYNVPVYLAICRQLNVRTACVPFAIGDLDALEKSIVFSPKSSPDYLLNSLFTGILKSWSVQQGKRRFLILPAETILTYRLMGVNIQYPLSFYGVQTDHLLLENEYMHAHAEKQRVAATEVTVTGAMLDDELVGIHREKTSHYHALGREFSWDTSKKLMCVALPPLVKKNNEDERFLSFPALAERFLPADVDLRHWNIIISLHPRIDQKHADSIPWPENVRWTTKPVEMLIPISDLFVATFSSTIRTAVALKVPVINYDLLNFNYHLFNDLPGILYVNTAVDYKNGLIDLERKGPVFTTLTKGLEAANPLSSTLDGHSRERLFTKITSILGHSFHQR